MTTEGRMVYLKEEGVMGEIISEQRYGAQIRYSFGGFMHEEFFTDEDYEIEDYFVEETE